MNSIFDDLPDGLIVLDGGMGQELINRKASAQGVLWSARALFDHPEVVQAVHEDYIRAGADVITTNSYACIRNNFEPEGLLDRLGEMNRLSAELAQRARDSAGKSVKIAGSLGPQRGSYRPDLVGSYQETEALYREQAEFLAPHVDLFICETLSCIVEARAAVVAASKTGKPVWLSWSGARKPGHTAVRCFSWLSGSARADMPAAPDGSFLADELVGQVDHGRLRPVRSLLSERRHPLHAPLSRCQ